MRKRRTIRMQNDSEARQFGPDDCEPFNDVEQVAWNAEQCRLLWLDVFRQAQADAQIDTWTRSRDVRLGSERAAHRRATVREAWAWLNDREDTGLGSCAWICSIFHESQAAAIAVAWYGRQLALAISDTVPDGYVDIITRPA